MRDILRRTLSIETRRRMALALVKARQPTSRWRPLPNLLVVGAQRCGTSSLFKYLGAHPKCNASARKEIRYFTEFYEQGSVWYRAHFPLSQPMRNKASKVFFEATPDYLLDPRVPARAVELLDEFRVIVLVRDPVDRAYSHYWHNRRLGTERLSFEDALAQEPSRIGSYLQKGQYLADLPTPKSFLRFSYVERGRYATQLERWLQLIEPTRLLVMKSEQLFKNTDQAYQEILQFLSLPEWRPESYRNFSYISEKPTHPPMNPDTRSRLTEVLADEVVRFDRLCREIRQGSVREKEGKMDDSMPLPTAKRRS